jgi:hypothetical protein
VNQKEALAFVERHGIVLQAARGPVPNLAEAIAGGPIRGSWWGHTKGKEIFRAADAICESPNVLVCKLIGGKITYVHRRLWPALVKLAPRFREEQLDHSVTNPTFMLFLQRIVPKLFSASARAREGDRRDLSTRACART